LEKPEKGNSYPEERIKEFQEEHNKIKESLDCILPERRIWQKIIATSPFTETWLRKMQ
jgi:hypothetical protein